MKILFWISFLCLSPFLFSCKNSDQHHAPSDKKYQFGLHLTAGEKYYYNINTETQTKLEVNSKKVDNNKSSEIGLIYEVLKDSADTVLVKITYDQLRINVKNNNNEKELDASNGQGSLNPGEKIFSTLKGSSIMVALNKKGDVLQVTGSQEIVDKLLVAMNTRDVNTKKMLQEQLSNFIGEEFIKNNLGQSLKLFPDTAVYIGDTWSRKNVISADLHSEALINYTLTSVKNNMAEVQTGSEISNNSNTNVMGIYAATKIEGKQEGRFEADINTGLLLTGQSTTSMDGTIQTMGKEIPITIKITKHITGKKI
jgi:hypothetical protein